MRISGAIRVVRTSKQLFGKQKRPWALVHLDVNGYCGLKWELVCVSKLIKAQLLNVTSVVIKAYGFKI
jgi:hypothetical protein